MESIKEEVKEIKEKKPRVTKSKKVDKPIIIKELSPVDPQILNKEEVKELVKEDIILSFDPGFKKMGIALINTKSGDYVKSFTIPVRPEGKLN